MVGNNTKFLYYGNRSLRKFLNVIDKEKHLILNPGDFIVQSDDDLFSKLLMLSSVYCTIMKCKVIVSKISSNLLTFPQR